MKGWCASGYDNWIECCSRITCAMLQTAVKLQKFKCLLHRKLSYKWHPVPAFKILAMQHTENKVILLISLSSLISVKLYHNLCKPCWFSPWSVPHGFPITLIWVCKLEQKVNSFNSFAMSALQLISSNSILNAQGLTREFHYFIFINDFNSRIRVPRTSCNAGYWNRI